MESSRASWCFIFGKLNPHGSLLDRLNSFAEVDEQVMVSDLAAILDPG